MCVGTSLSIVQPDPSLHHEAADRGHRISPCRVHLQEFDGDLEEEEEGRRGGGGGVCENFLRSNSEQDVAADN